MMRASLVLCLLNVVGIIRAQYIPDPVVPEDSYEVTFTIDSNIWWRTENATWYYCIYRSLWTSGRHPAEYPADARWSDIVMYSALEEYTPWVKGRATTDGVEQIAENGNTARFQLEFGRQGSKVLDISEGEAFVIDQTNWEKNYAFIPPIEMNFDYPYLNAIAGMLPSPDWFTGFYLYRPLDRFDQTMWSRFTLKTYPWDAGTDAGQSYGDVAKDIEIPLDVSRITETQYPSSGAFLSPDKSQVMPVGEFDCLLHICPLEQRDCVKPDFPPPNFCDVLRYPSCATYCDPKKDSLCEACHGNGYEASTVHLKDCCAGGHEPKKGKSCNDKYIIHESGAASMLTALSMALAVGSTLLLASC